MARDRSFNTRVRRAIIDTVAEFPGITIRELEAEVSYKVERKRGRGDYFMGGGYFYQRVERIVKRGDLRKIMYRTTPYVTTCNHYFTPDKIPAGFDLSVETDRLVAADFVQDKGDEAVAAVLRKAKRGG